MAGLDFNIIIGAALGTSVGQVFSSIKKQATLTVKDTEKLQLGKKWTEEILDLTEKLKLNKEEMRQVGKTAETISIRKELLERLGTAREEAAKFGVNMGNAKEQLSKFNKELAKSERKERFGEAFAKFKGDATKTAQSAVAVGAILKKGFDLTSTFTKFQAGMADTATLLDGDKIAKKARIDVLGKAVRKMALETGADLRDLQSGLYQTVSAFGDNEETVKRLDIATKAAIGGKASTTDAINLMSAVTKGYGDTSAEATQKAMDLAFQTVKLGQTDFPALAASMGQVIPTAATLKVKQEELFGAYSTLTGVTGTASEVSTQLKATLAGLLDPSEKMNRALQRLGYSSGKEILEQRGLAGTLAALKFAVNDDELAFAKLFGSMEAKNAVLALTGNQAGTFAEKTSAMYKATGAAQAAYEEQSETDENRNRRLGNSFKEIALNLGEALLPAFQILTTLTMKVTSVVARFTEQFPILSRVVFLGAAALTGFRLALNFGNMLRDTVNMLKNTSLAHYAHIAAIKTGAAIQWLWNHAVAAGSGIIGTVVGFIRSLKIAQTAGAVATKIATAAQWLWNGALLANPIGMIVLAIGAFVALAYTVYKHWEPILSWFNAGLDKIKQGWQALFGGGDEKKTITAVSKIEDLNSGGSHGSISVAKDIPMQTSVKNEKNVNVSMPNITINSANLDESLPTITEKVRAAIMAGVKDDMENSYAY